MEDNQAVGSTDDIPRGAPAPWQSHPSIVAEVEALKQKYTATDLSVAEVLCDVHPAEDTAFICVDDRFEPYRLSYGELSERSRRLATYLSNLGVGCGSRVGVLMEKTQQLPIVQVALWRLGAIEVPLFTAFAGPAIATRVNDAEAALIVADAGQQHKLKGIDIPVLGTGPDLDQEIDVHEPIGTAEKIGGDGLFLQLYTSGTTGTPKAVGVPGRAIGAFIAYMRYGLDVADDDVFWNAADPGWAYGLYYGVVGPMAIGQANILFAGRFTPEMTGRLFEELKVTNLAAAPTIYRALKKDGVRAENPLRVASSAGEPLTSDVVEWAPEALGVTVRDHWGQTEQGMAICNPWDERLLAQVAPNSMGQALPGFVAGTVGPSIALSVLDSPLMWFSGYVGDPDRTMERFTEDGAWYFTGDVGRSEDANFFFASRDDDVILAAGYRIAPFDIESILVTDDVVVEAAVVGRPDEIRGEVVVAFVVTNQDVSEDELQKRLQQAVRDAYGAHAYPRRVHIVGELPKTPSGKVQRFVLREAAI
ncbi:AMP-binding protein [Brevibacterium renqingii]|uniref:AMP-binding protein n=1 Tax=Brevibacterium renqingii TaxID=2776916 RepID=UPI001ADFDD67|nr:AMP-binding protein [Brevibacterium renqingii]